MFYTYTNTINPGEGDRATTLHLPQFRQLGITLSQHLRLHHVSVAPC